jgi:hypothetical protein
VHYRRDQRSAEDTNKKNASQSEEQQQEEEENILKRSVIDTIKKVRDNPAKVLLVPVLCVGYAMLLGGLYVNMLMYHSSTNIRARHRARRKSRY